MIIEFIKNLRNNTTGKLTLLTKGKYKYYEVFALDKELPIPIEHAWNVKDGNVIDLTYEQFVKNQENIEYFGVEVPYDFLKEIGEKFLISSAKTPLKEYFVKIIK